MAKREFSSRLIPLILVRETEKSVTFSDVYKNSISYELPRSYFMQSQLRIDDSQIFDSRLEKDCLGGSTIGCIAFGTKACFGDTWCLLMCRSAGRLCQAAIALLCTVHYTKAEEVVDKK